MTSQNASSTSAATPAKGPSRVQAITANELRFVPNPTFSIIDPSPSPPLSPLNTALVKDTRRYIYPFTGHTLGNRAVANRPRIRNTWRQWPPCTSSHPFLFTNPGTLCYRDASLTFLLASPALFNWSAAHVRGSAWTCLIRDCLVCAFHALGKNIPSNLICCFRYSETKTLQIRDRVPELTGASRYGVLERGQTGKRPKI